MQATTGRPTLRLVPNNPVQDERSARVEACTILVDAYVEALRVPGLNHEDRQRLRSTLAVSERVAGRRTELAAV